MRYVLKRLLQAVLVMWGVTTVLFIMLHSVPGGPETALAGPDATPEILAAIRQQYGLNDSLIAQYVHWLGHILTGNLGSSVIYNLPVGKLISQALQPTLQIVIGSMIIAIIAGVSVGTLAAVKARKTADVFIGYATAGLLGIPHFWLGILLLILFSVKLKWIPTGGYASILDNPGAAVESMILPVLVLGITIGAVIARFVRASLLEQLGADYVRTARAKGAPRWAVIVKHALRNALIPTMTVVGIQFGVLLGGTVIIEQVFARPGMGQLVTSAVGNRDYNVVQGVVLVLVGAFTLINLLVDMAYGLVDPRIRR
ncbi:ABC transporter permease [Kribbella sp. CA-245084]|uniref:ABC transporter permease n=1 Tax=Kribbella sp. CA-245084 TaxID=3239940 RepID=UPI003D8ED8A2